MFSNSFLNFFPKDASLIFCVVSSVIKYRLLSVNTFYEVDMKIFLLHSLI